MVWASVVSISPPETSSRFQLPLPSWYPDSLRGFFSGLPGCVAPWFHPPDDTARGSVRHPMNRLIRLLAASVLLHGAGGIVPARAWQAAGSDPALIDLAPQRYAVPDVPRDVPSDVAPDAGASGSAPDSGIRYDLLFLDGPAEGYRSRRHGVGLRWFGTAADPAEPPDRFGSVPSSGLDAWSLGARNWRYRSSAGYRLTLGNTASDAPGWGRSVRLAGVGLARSVSQD